MENKTQKINAFADVLDSLRLPENFTSSVGGITLPPKPTFGKLSKHRFSRVHPGNEYKLPIFVVDDKESREVFLCSAQMAPYLSNLAQPKILRLAVDNMGTPKVIAEPIVEPSARTSLWTVTMLEAIRRAETQWVRIESNMSAQQYTIIEEASNLGEPAWPEQTMQKLIEEIFTDRIITRNDHPLILQLEGRA